jgi:hypothetical protein
MHSYGYFRLYKVEKVVKMGEGEIAKLKDQIMQNYQAAYRLLSSPVRISSQTLIAVKLASMQNDAAQLARIMGEHETQAFLLDVMLHAHEVDIPQRQEPLFQPGALIQRASGATTLYRVVMIQYIEQTPYYHIVSSNGRYLIISHAQIHQWRKAAINDISAQATTGKEGKVTS